MAEELKTEINVSTWLAVIADMARSRQRDPRIEDPGVAMARVLNLARYLEAATLTLPREILLQIAAEAIRAADEHFPGDGLDLG